MSGPRWTALGAALGALAVALGAFGAHALEDALAPEQLDWWHTAVQYQALHAVALALFGLFRERRPGSSAAGWCFTAGTLIFAGTLYGLALGGPRWLGAITPIGGVAMIAGWFLFAAAAWRKPR
jgi:uncharacterized membrane protein YgdD (TMEM256/DUF423 family)